MKKGWMQTATGMMKKADHPVTAMLGGALLGHAAPLPVLAGLAGGVAIAKASKAAQKDIANQQYALDKDESSVAIKRKLSGMSPEKKKSTVQRILKSGITK